MWELRFTKNAEKDKENLKRAQLMPKAKKLLNLIAEDPYRFPPTYEKLVGDLQGYCSRRMGIQHRLVYRVFEDAHIVVVHSMWSHYDE